MTERRVLIVGAGAIGLSTAWELSQRGATVTVIDRGAFGRKASWAGAGILVPAKLQTATQPLDQLLGYGSDTHETWARRLLQETGIDNGFRKCGGVYLARTPGERAALAGQKSYWRESHIEFEDLTADDLRHRFEQIAVNDSTSAVWVPSESQICNPAHLQALETACRNSGVGMIPDTEIVEFETDGERIVAADCGPQRLEFDQLCCCAGAWSAALLKQLGFELPIIPVRGQMLLYRLPHHTFVPIINEGSRYIVPREDGHVLVGSTTEEVGFDESTTEEKLRELQDFAASIVPALSGDRLLRTWAGLRPASNDGFPMMGRIQPWNNLFVSTGHFKAGLQMSAGAALMVADMMEGRQPELDPAPFEPSRLHFSFTFDVSTR